MKSIVLYMSLCIGLIYADHNPTAVFIIGTGRSGTSCATGVLQILGLPLGDNLSAGNQFNQKGSFEDRAISHLDQQLIKEFDMQIHTLKFIDWQEDQRLFSCTERIKHVLHTQFNTYPFFGVKHPHISFFLPAYLQAAEQLAYTPKIVVVLRRPEEVVASFIHRYPNEPEERFYSLVSNYLTTIMLYQQHYETVTILYDDLLYKPQQTINKLRTLLPQLFSYDQVKTEIDDFIDDGLKHHNSTDLSKADVPANFLEFLWDGDY